MAKLSQFSSVATDDRTITKNANGELVSIRETDLYMDVAEARHTAGIAANNYDDFLYKTPWGGIGATLVNINTNNNSGISRYFATEWFNGAFDATVYILSDLGEEQHYYCNQSVVEVDFYYNYDTASIQTLSFKDYYDEQYLIITATSGTDNQASINYTYDVNMTRNEWHTIRVERDGNSNKLYIDGIYQGNYSNRNSTYDNGNFRRVRARNNQSYAITKVRNFKAGTENSTHTITTNTKSLSFTPIKAWFSKEIANVASGQSITFTLHDDQGNSVALVDGENDVSSLASGNVHVVTILDRNGIDAVDTPHLHEFSIYFV